jgi:hypothetical protein
MHVVGVQSALPGKAVFVHDPPEGSASVQSPGPSAFGSSSEASQLAARLIMRGVVMVEDVVVNARYKINNAWRCGGGGRGRECACSH